MLSPVRLAAQWRTIERELPERWAEARLLLTVEDAAQVSRAAGLLGPATPGRHGRELRLAVTRGPTGTSPGALERLLERLDREGIPGTLEQLGTANGLAPVAVTPPRHRPLVELWDEAVATLPGDWSDLLCEVALRSTDFIERGALLMAPLNPTRDGDRVALRFRVARVFGYGASPGMARRCLARCDAESVSGTFRILRALSETDPVATQGPVWYVGGRAV